MAVKVNAYLSDVTRFAEYNEIYKEVLCLCRPVRGPPGETSSSAFSVEVDRIAALPDAAQP